MSCSRTTTQSGFALPIAIVAKCEEIINLAQKILIWRQLLAKEKSQVNFFVWRRNRHLQLQVISLNVFIANTKQGVGPQVFPTLVTALPLQYTYKALHRQWRTYLSRDMRFPTMRYVRPTKVQTSLRIRTV